MEQNPTVILHISFSNLSKIVPTEAYDAAAWICCNHRRRCVCLPLETLPSCGKTIRNLQQAYFDYFDGGFLVSESIGKEFINGFPDLSMEKFIGFMPFSLIVQCEMVENFIRYQMHFGGSQSFLAQLQRFHVYDMLFTALFRFSLSCSNRLI
ncbi:hypothetical protein KFK09_018899 [Dendrobium nobile]|uniref:Uncharacterized protein n=1 Tax=Dendrobium nobile TaxID=94219 RepID=A0A8T3AW24_DENNO|nr:hypothetical protein KFK09_018899 [Dendrobium nobile]